MKYTSSIATKPVQTTGIILILLLLTLSACATYYQKQATFQKNVEQGNFKEADEILASDKKAEQRKTKLLYYMNRGVVNHLMGDYKTSNIFFEKAYLYIEDRQTNYVDIAASFLTNPTLVAYQGEDHEKIFIHYYKALNYLLLNDRQKALVECRRLNIKLNQLSDRYQSNKKFKKDAFIHMLMGIIYDANHDYNNAFIAYRNALEIYETDYRDLFGMEAPLQLKKDLLRTAHLIGFDEEQHQYEKTFGFNYKPEPHNQNLIVFWNNGLSPVKTEWGLNFIIIHGEGGLVTFYNETYNLSFPFFLPDHGADKGSLGNLELVRVTFPKYLERPPVYQQAYINYQDNIFSFEQAENINAIAFKVLEQRLLLELSQSLLRLALKKSTEHLIRKENQDLGAVVGIVNALTEKADTRNWQTLPHNIYYSRIPLPPGQQNLNMVIGSSSQQEERQLSVTIQKGQTHFYSFSSLASMPPPSHY